MIKQAHRGKLASQVTQFSRGRGETWTLVCRAPKCLLFLLFQLQRRLRSCSQSDLVLGRWCTVSGSVFQKLDMTWVKAVCLMNSSINNSGHRICPAAGPHGSRLFIWERTIGNQRHSRFVLGWALDLVWPRADLAIYIYPRGRLWIWPRELRGRLKFRKLLSRLLKGWISGLELACLDSLWRQG